MGGKNSKKTVNVKRKQQERLAQETAVEIPFTPNGMFKTPSHVILAKKIELFSSKKAMFEKLADGANQKTPGKPDHLLAKCLLDENTAKQIIALYQQQYKTLNDKDKTIPARYVPFGEIDKNMQKGNNEPDQAITKLWRLAGSLQLEMTKYAVKKKEQQKQKILEEQKMIKHAIIDPEKTQQKLPEKITQTIEKSETLEEKLLKLDEVIRNSEELQKVWPEHWPKDGDAIIGTRQSSTRAETLEKAGVGGYANKHPQTKATHVGLSLIKKQYKDHGLEMYASSQKHENEAFEDSRDTYVEMKQDIEKFRKQFAQLVLAGVKIPQKFFVKGIFIDHNHYLHKTVTGLVKDDRVANLLKIIDDEAVKHADDIQAAMEKMEPASPNPAATTQRSSGKPLRSPSPSIFKSASTSTIQMVPINHKVDELAPTVILANRRLAPVDAPVSDHSLLPMLAVFLLVLTVLTLLWRRFSRSPSAKRRNSSIVYHGSRVVQHDEEVEPGIDMV